MSFTARLSDYLGTRELYGRMLRIALPISAQSLITVGINLMDTIMLSGMVMRSCPPPLWPASSLICS